MIIQLKYVLNELYYFCHSGHNYHDLFRIKINHCEVIFVPSIKEKVFVTF